MQSWRGEVCAVAAGCCVLSPSCSILLLTLEGQLIRELYNCHISPEHAQTSAPMNCTKIRRGRYCRCIYVDVDISPRCYEVCPVCEDHLGEVFLLSGEVPLQPREQRRPEHVVKLLPVHAALPLKQHLVIDISFVS